LADLQLDDSEFQTDVEDEQVRKETFKYMSLAKSHQTSRLNLPHFAKVTIAIVDF